MKNLLLHLSVFFGLLFLLSTESHAQWEPNVRLTNDPGISIGSRHTSTCIATSGNNVHIVWMDKRGVFYQIYYKHSHDGGINWEDEKRLSYVSVNESYPTIAVSGSVVHVVWMDYREGYLQVYYKSSIDGGENWGLYTDTRLSDNIEYSKYPVVSASGSNVYVVWVWSTVFGEHKSNVYFRRSIDGGKNWDNITPLTNNNNAGVSASIAVSGSVLHVVWPDDGKGAIYYKRSIDGGITWGGDKQLSSIMPLQLIPSILVSGSVVHVLWNHQNYSSPGIPSFVYYMRSEDGGDNWGLETKLINSSGQSMYPSGAVSGSAVHVVWCDNRDGNMETYYKRSIDGGLNWEDDTRLTNSHFDSWYANVAINCSNVHVVWADSVDGNLEIYYKRNSTGNPTGNLCGTKFNDRDQNGVQTEGEEGLQNWTIKVEPDLFTTTDELGHYCFTCLPFGTNTIREIEQNGWTNTTQVCTTVTVVPELTATVDFGNVQDTMCSCFPFPPPNGMVGWWPLDEAVGAIAAADLTVDPIDGIYVGPTPVPARVGRGLDFDGLDDRLRIVNRPKLNFGTGDFSIDAWIRTSDAMNLHSTIVYKTAPDPSGNLRGYSLYLNQGNLVLQLSSGLGTSTDYTSSLFVADGRWHHIAVTVSRDHTDGLLFYRDGVVSPPFDPTGENGSLTNTDILFMGRGRPGLINLFKGILDEVELFNKVLSPEEVTSIYHAFSCGKCKPGSLRGRKFNDLDGDGIQDAGEPGIVGWKIYLSNGESKPTVQFGDYNFDNLSPGTYTICESGRDGWKNTTQNCTTVTVAAGQVIYNLNFGNRFDTTCSCFPFPPPNGMVGWWPLDEAAGAPAAADLTINPIDGIYVGRPTPVLAKVGRGLDFDGKDDRLRVPDQAKLNFGTDNFSIDTWIRTSDPSKLNSPIVNKIRQDLLSNWTGYSLYLSQGNLVLQLATGLGAGTNYNSGLFIADGQWHHIAVTVQRNSTTGIVFYCDGVRYPSYFDPTSHTGSLSNINPLLMGRGRPGSTNFFSGTLDEVELFSRVLSPEEISNIFIAGRCGKCKPGSLRGVKFNDLNGNGKKESGEEGLPNWTINLSGGESTTTDAQGNYSFNNLSPESYTVSEVPKPGWKQITPKSPDYYTKTLSQGQVIYNLDFGNVQDTICSCFPRPNGMVAWWSLDEAAGPTVMDLILPPALGTYVNAPTPVKAKVRRGLYFDGVNDYVRVPDHPKLNFGTNNFSIDAWIQPYDSVRLYSTIVDKRAQDSLGNWRGYSLYLNQGNLVLALATGSATFTDYNSGLFIADGQWHHIAVTVSRTATNGILFYHNGTVFPGTFDPTSQMASLTNTNQLFMGRSKPVLNLFKGTLDEVELFNRVLSPEEIASIFLADSCGKCKPQNNLINLIPLESKWNLISIPNVQSDYTAEVVFPGKYGSMFGYSQVLGDYVEAPTLDVGLGYWVYYADATIIVISGDVADTVKITCKAGWNLIGSREREVQVSDLQLSAGSIYGSAFYYNTGIGDYAETAVIAPGQGIWIYVTQDCELTIP